LSITLLELAGVGSKIDYSVPGIVCDSHSVVYGVQKNQSFQDLYERYKKWEQGRLAVAHDPEQSDLRKGESPMTVDQLRSDDYDEVKMTRTSVTIWVLLGVALLGVVGFLVYGKSLSVYFETKVFELTYQFLLLIVLGGAVSLLFREHVREREVKDEERMHKQEEADARQVREQEASNAKQARLREMYSDLLVAYNKAKKVRRVLRARAIKLEPAGTSQRIQVILGSEYDAHMSDLIDAQLTFETYAKLAEDRLLWFEEAGALAGPLRNIEGYLNKIIKEYTTNYKTFEGDPPCKPLSELLDLKEFIGPYRESREFRTQFQDAFRDTLKELGKALLY
jgi:hypothetical protein